VAGFLRFLLIWQVLADIASRAEPPDKQNGPEDAEHYESLIVRRVLSAQMENAEQNQWHTLFQTKCVIKERSCCLFIDGGSCYNLARNDMVEKIALSTTPHSCPYYIRWMNNNGKVKVTRLVRLVFLLVHTMILLSVMLCLWKLVIFY
jgi:hypothetical protein